MISLKEYNNKIIGKQIQKYRLSKDYSLKKLSDITGISESYLRLLENGGVSENSSIGIENIYKIAEALGVTLDDLAYTNIEHIDSVNNSIITDIEIELKTLNKSDLQLFDKVVGIFVDRHKHNLKNRS